MMKFIFGMQINIEVFYRLILKRLQKRMGYEVDFLPADKHESSPQVDSIILGVRSQKCHKYPKQQVCNIFAISQGKRVKDEVDFLLPDKRQRSLEIDTIILGVCGQACPNYPK